MTPKDWRHTRAFQTLARTVIAEEPRCWLNLPGCTVLSTTADHVLTVRDYPELVMERVNLRGACAHCNFTRGAKKIGEKFRDAEKNPRALDFFL